MTDTTSTYDLQAAAFATLYESVTAESVHVADFIPRGAGLSALDVGAGSGRDAAWLVSLGFDVLAVEPARGMRPTRESVGSTTAFQISIQSIVSV
jgi:hypothetical protein